MFYQVSKNNHRTCWVLKCDIKKFFDNINHGILVNILRQYIPNNNIISLLQEVIESFSNRNDRCGLPLGNLTSQLFANVYMNVFDQFVKHKLKARYYIRYADDFVFLSHNREHLKNLIPEIQKFLLEKLKLNLHPNKVFLQTVASGIDFLGWKHFVDHRVLRETTRKRMLRRIKGNPTNGALQSYLGLLKHGNSIKIKDELLGEYWLWK